MNRRYLFSIPAVAAVGLVSTTVRADEPVKSLTLDRAIQLALAHNPDSRSADEDVTSAGGALVQSRLLPNPSLFVSSLGRSLSPLDGPIPTQVGLTWTIPIGGKRGAGIKAAEATVDAARATRVAARRQVALTVEKAFIAVLLDQAQLEFAAQDQDGIRQSLDLNELRYRDGKIAFGDVLKLQIQVRAVEDIVRQDELQLGNDRAELARLTGDGSLAADYVVAGSLTAPAELPAAPLVDAVLAKALKDRTDYQALLAQERTLSALATQARRQPIPDLGVLVDYDDVPGQGSQYDITLSVSIPIFDQNQGNVTQAEAAFRKARIATQGLRAQIREDVQQAVNGWKASHARLAVYDAELLSVAKQSLDITRHAYEQGRGTLLDYLDAESSYRQVASAYRVVLANAMIAAATLRFVAGEDLP